MYEKILTLSQVPFVPCSTQTQRCFPIGLNDLDYYPLLFLLYDRYSNRALADLIAKHFNRNYYKILNDVYGIINVFRPSIDDIERVIKILIENNAGCSYGFMFLLR